MGCICGSSLSVFTKHRNFWGKDCNSVVDISRKWVCIPEKSSSLLSSSSSNLLLYFGRRFLRETLKMSNAEDLNRLTACSLVLLGHIFYVLGNHRVSSKAFFPLFLLSMGCFPFLNLDLGSGSWLVAHMYDLVRSFHQKCCCCFLTA